MSPYQPEASSFDLALLCCLQIPDAEIRTVIQHALAALSPGGALLFIAHALDDLEHGIGSPQDPLGCTPQSRSSPWCRQRLSSSGPKAFAARSARPRVNGMRPT